MKATRMCWQKEEDMVLLKLYKTYGEQWKKIAEVLHLSKQFNGKMRTAASCRERYNYILKPNLNKEEWSQDEEKKLFQLLQQYGNSWSQITTRMEYRSELVCKNYFYATIRRVLRRLAKQAGIEKPSQLLKKIKPNILMNIYLDSPHAKQIVINENVRTQLKILICQYQFIKKEQIINFSFEEKENVKNLLGEIIQVNDSYQRTKKPDQLNQQFKNLKSEPSSENLDQIVKKINDGEKQLTITSLQSKQNDQNGIVNFIKQNDDYKLAKTSVDSDNLNNIQNLQVPQTQQNFQTYSQSIPYQLPSQQLYYQYNFQIQPILNNTYNTYNPYYLYQSFQNNFNAQQTVIDPRNYLCYMNI